MDLKEQLEKAKIQGFSGKRFIPSTALHRLIDAKSVRDYFCFKNVKLSRADSEEIIQKARRLFAINVLLDQGCVVQEYLSEGHGDKNLPYFKISDIPEIGSAAYRSSFYGKQWQIPTILQPAEHRNFPTGFIPPVTIEDKQPKDRGGMFGYVYKVRVANGHLAGHSSKQPLALKEIRTLPGVHAKTMMREVQTLQARRHDLIVPLLASWTGQVFESEYERACLNLLFPWARMDLEVWLYQDRPPRDWEGKDQGRLKEYIYHSILSISEAVTFVHSEIEGFISSHHDIKPKNILLFDRTWKLADFGRTHLLRAAQVSDTEGTLGTYTYQPPEYRNSLGEKAEKRHGRAFDVWSLGCITVEFATIAVHGWQGEKLLGFRVKRVRNQDRPKRTPEKYEGQDDSFSNNMNVVRDWTRQLLRDDQSPDLRSMLRIAETMMIEEEGLRYLSWEVYLDLYELLHPNGTTKDTETKTRAVVQRPSRHHEKTKHHPLRRAYEQGNKPRVKWLLKTGWAGHPLDLPEIDKKDPSEIVMWIRTAKAMQGLSWRRLLHETIPQDLIAKAKASGRFHENQRLDLGPSREVSAEVERALVSSRPSTAFKKGSVEQDEHGMTKMHLECQNADFWRVLQFSEKSSPKDWDWIMTHKDSVGRLPLHYAANNGSSQIIKYLLESFSLNPTMLVAEQDHEGKTPLHLASQRGDINAIKSLLHAHKDPVPYSTLKDKRNRTACDVALHYGHNNAYELLRRILGGN